MAIMTRKLLAIAGATTVAVGLLTASQIATSGSAEAAFAPPRLVKGVCYAGYPRQVRPVSWCIGRLTKKPSVYKPRNRNRNRNRRRVR